MKFFVLLFFLTNLVFAVDPGKINNMMNIKKAKSSSSKENAPFKFISNNFEKNFKLVSVHFREDKYELRFIYGNQLAFKGIKNKKYQYDDGAIFYKVVYRVDKDPSFQASLRPQKQPFVRQVMIRDQKRYKETNGWGYAIYSQDGDSMSDDPDKTIATCYACHKIVGERNDIFSRPVETILPNQHIETEPNLPVPTSKVIEISEKLFKFKFGLATDIPNEVLSNIAKSEKYNIMVGEILKQDVPFYIPEITSFLIKKTIENGFPSVVFKKFDQQLIYNYSYIDKNDKTCKSNEYAVRAGVGNTPELQHRTTLKIIKKCIPRK